MHVQPSRHRADATAPCGILGHALVSARLSELAALRDGAGPPGAPTLPPRFLRHCDEHTVVGMHAVLRVLADWPAGPADVERHGVVSASCGIGRLTAARTLANLAAGGGVSVTPHVVPQCSLHSVAGAVSVGLGMRGPHLGVGGGCDALAEGLATAVTLLGSPAATGDPPCIWIVATEWHEEPTLDDSGAPVGDPLCHGLAVATCRGESDLDADDGGESVEPRRRSAAGIRGTAATWSSTLSLRASAVAPARENPAASAGRVAEFARVLDMCRVGTALVSWSIECPWGAEIRVGVSRRPVARALPATPWREAA